jgi:hypothetical protein
MIIDPDPGSAKATDLNGSVALLGTGMQQKERRLSLRALLPICFRDLDAL